MHLAADSLAQLGGLLKLLESKRRRGPYSIHPRGAPLLRGLYVTTSDSTWLTTRAYLPGANEQPATNVATCM